MSAHQDPVSPTRHPVWRVIKIAAGCLLLGLGFLGLFLPILQGILFLAAGVGVLSTEVPWIRRLRLRWIDKFRERRKRRRDAEIPMVTALLLGGILLAGTGCLNPHAEGSGMVETREVPVYVTIESTPAGASVTDLSNGKVLGTTPLRVRALVLRFEDWLVVNDPEERGRLMDETSGTEGGYALAGTTGGKEPDEALAPPLRLRYRLDLEDHHSLVLSREIDPRTLPLLAERPEITLKGDLAHR